MNRALMDAGRARALALLLGAILALSPLLLPARPARAATTFTVNLTSDAADLDLTDNVCDVSSVKGLNCTLRAAIQQANATSGANTITFNIRGTGVQTIRPNRELPRITETVTIDGYTQPGARPNTLATGTNAVLRIELDGTNAIAFAGGLWIEAANTVVRGLAINHFGIPDPFIVLAGIIVTGATTTGVRITGCFLGTDATGTDARTNGYGLHIKAPNTIIGGATPADRNLISGNSKGLGVVLAEDAVGSRVVGNLIGTTKSGTAPLPNGGDGVISSATNTVIGADSAAAANVIAFNGSAGVSVLSGTRNRILHNAIFANGGLGIDLSHNGVTANDPGDGDTGPNTLQNKPFLTAAITNLSTRITGQLNSTPGQTFLLRFFANPSGNEGKTFLGQLSVTTDATGNGSFAFAPLQRVAVGQTITATATNAGGNTSEFSPPRTVEPPVAQP